MTQFTVGSSDSLTMVAPPSMASPPTSSGTGPRWPSGVEGVEHPVDVDPGPLRLRCTPAHGAGAPGRQVAGRGITWGGTGRDIPGTLPVPCSPSARDDASPDRARAPRYALAAMTSPEDLQAQADALHWYHTIDLGNGVVTKGDSAQDDGTAILPDVAGRSVLDIGAWDGKYSFLAEQAGASRVVALDHYAWGVDFAARGAYWAECIQRGTLPDQSRDETDFWQPDLPGRRGFELAAAALGSKVEPLVADFQTVDLDEVGQFDVVLYLGVLYHMKEPLTCLERLRRVTKEVAVIETEAVHLARARRRGVAASSTPAARCAPTSATGTCPPSRRCTTCAGPPGFSEVRTVIGPPAAPPPRPRRHCKVKLGRRLAGVVAGRRPRRRPPTTAPSSTPSPDRGGAGPGSGRRRPACGDRVSRSPRCSPSSRPHVCDRAPTASCPRRPVRRSGAGR